MDAKKKPIDPYNLSGTDAAIVAWVKGAIRELAMHFDGSDERERGIIGSFKRDSLSIASVADVTIRTLITRQANILLTTSDERGLDQAEIVKRFLRYKEIATAQKSADEATAEIGTARIIPDDASFAQALACLVNAMPTPTIDRIELESGIVAEVNHILDARDKAKKFDIHTLTAWKQEAAIAMKERREPTDGPDAEMLEILREAAIIVQRKAKITEIARTLTVQCGAGFCGDEKADAYVAGLISGTRELQDDPRGKMLVVALADIFHLDEGELEYDRYAAAAERSFSISLDTEETLPTLSRPSTHVSDVRAKPAAQSIGERFTQIGEEIGELTGQDTIDGLAVAANMSRKTVAKLLKGRGSNEAIPTKLYSSGKQKVAALGRTEADRERLKSLLDEYNGLVTRAKCEGLDAGFSAKR